jgi:hypothetical protein
MHCASRSANDDDPTPPYIQAMKPMLSFIAGFAVGAIATLFWIAK